VREGYDSSATADAIFFDDSEMQIFNRVDVALYRRIEAGLVRV